MIGRLTGELVAQPDGAAIVDVHGVGYEVQIPMGTVGRLTPDAGGRVTLHVHTHAREDALTLFGFATEADRLAFRTLIGVSSIGPKTALAVLGSLPADALARAIASKSLGELTQVPGIGKKTAERMVLELRDKLPTATGATAVPGSGVAPPVARGKSSSAELLAGALTRMGYRPAESDRAIAALGERVESASLPELVREALALLSK
jgi:Holliday junction DNA helicase RuvA